eukprot:scaffold13002_cov125-Isochrysis_galbana.AAC.11
MAQHMMVTCIRLRNSKHEVGVGEPENERAICGCDTGVAGIVIGHESVFHRRQLGGSHALETPRRRSVQPTWPMTSQDSSQSRCAGN